MISLVNLKISMSILGAYGQSSPEVSNIKTFFIATSSFDVWVIEHKITGLPRCSVVKNPSSNARDNTGLIPHLERFHMPWGN